MKRILQWVSLYSDDVKGVIKVLVLLILVVGGYRYLPIMLQQAGTIKLKGETIGVVTKKRKVEKIYESEMGGKLGIKGYQIEYFYLVEGKEVNKKAYVDKLRYTMKERMKLFQLQAGDTIKVKYDLDAPNKSAIFFD
ncbi:MAG: hypothetical protein AAFY76_06175 [Cyanobacteria bacterium J06649_11]